MKSVLQRIKRYVKCIVWLTTDLWYSIRYGEFGVAWFWKKEDRYENGYHYCYYDGPNSVIWLGPLHIWWMGDSFGKDEWHVRV